MSGETKLVSDVGDSMVNGKRAKAAVVELVRGTSRLDVTTQQPYKLVGLVPRCFTDVLVVVTSLVFLCKLQLIAQLVMKTIESAS